MADCTFKKWSEKRVYVSAIILQGLDDQIKGIHSMSDKAKSIYFGIFSLVYMVYIFFIVQHGIDWSNSTIFFIGIALAIYYYLKSKKERNI